MNTGTSTNTNMNNSSTSTIRNIDSEEFRRCQQDPSHCIVDVRSQEEFQSGSEANVCWPLPEINAANLSGFVREQQLSPDQPVVLLCARGMRAQQAAEKLRTLIPNPIAVVSGGHAALAEASGKTPPMSLERQVRIAAGVLVLAGLVVGMWLHPLALGLSAFVACGLIFAGITDWCGMAQLMARMPWNKDSWNKG